MSFARMFSLAFRPADVAASERAERARSATEDSSKGRGGASASTTMVDSASITMTELDVHVNHDDDDDDKSASIELTDVSDQRDSAEAVSRAIEIASFARCPLYVVHLSTADGLEHIVRARARGQTVYAETCPQYLLLTNAEMTRQKGLAKIAPPLRENRDREALWAGLARGDVQILGSDHAPFMVADKAIGERDIFQAGFGMPGVETMLPLVLGESLRAGRLSLPQLAAAASENAATIFGLYPRKGIITPGADADLLVVDPAAEWTVSARDLHSRAGYTCFENWPVKGRITMSFLRGRPLVKDGRLHQSPGYGRFLRRTPMETR